MKKYSVYRENYFIQYALLVVETLIYAIIIIIMEINETQKCVREFIFLFFYISYSIIIPLLFKGRTLLMIALGIHIVDRKNKTPNRFLIALRGVFYPIIAGIGVYVTFIAGLAVKDWPFDPLFGWRMVRINKTGKPVYARRTFEAEL